jgi:hypothetical protein
MKKMKIHSYPIVDYYLKEIEKIKDHSDLSVILVAGTLSELIMRELSDDSETHFKKLLLKYVHDEIIDQYQFDIADEIRNIRNRYIHIDIGKMIKYWDGTAIIDANGTITFSIETVINSDNPEKEIPKFYSINLQIYSERILLLLKKLLKSFD